MSIVTSCIPTPEGRAALDNAGEAARKRGVGVVILDAQGAADRVAVADMLTAFAAKYPDVTSEVRVLGGAEDVADGMIRLAESEAAELIVIGLRRRSRVGKLNLGFNVQKVLLKSSCEVLAVKSA